MKKRIALLLCISMLLVLLPVNAAAAGKITSVSISGIPFPEPGEHPSFDSSKLVSGDPDLYSAEIYEWYSYEPLTTSDTFHLGQSYWLSIRIIPKPGVSGLDVQAAQSMTVTFNGKRANFYSYGDNGPVYQLEIICTSRDMINSINVNGLQTPAIGDKAITADDLVVPEGSGYQIFDSEWFLYDVSGREDHQPLPQDFTFDKSKTYFLAVYLIADEGKAFGPDPELSFDGNFNPVNPHYSGFLTEDSDDIYVLVSMPRPSYQPIRITFDPDASMGGYVGQTEILLNDLQYTISDLPIPVTDREDLHFDGWYREGNNFRVSSESYFETDTVLHAKWSEGTPELHFDDLSEKAWYYDGVSYCCRRGLMNGTSDTAFSPNRSTTRAMIVTILNRMEGTPVSAKPNPFRDVKFGTWYTKGVLWAQDAGIVTGYGNGKFGPNDSITREQLATILYRYYKSKGYDVSAQAELTDFPDAKDVSAFAKDAMRWAVEEGIITGVASNGETNLKPKGTATRAMVATMLQRCIVKMAETD